MSRFIRNSLFGTVAGVSTTLGNFLSSLVVSRLLGVDRAGSVALAVWAVWLGTTVINIGLPSTLARYLPEIGARQGADLARCLAVRLFKPFAAWAALPACLGLAIGAGLRHGDAAGMAGPLGDPVVCVLVGLTVAAQSVGDYLRSAARGLHAFDRVATVTGSAAILQVVALSFGSALFGVRGAVAAYAVATLLPLALFREIAGPAGPPQPAVVRRMLRYAGFRYASDLLGFLVWSRIEILFLQLTWGLGAIGLFSAGMTLANLAVQGPLMLTMALLPQFAELHGRQDRDGLRRLYSTGTRLLAFLIFPACFGLAAILPVLLPLLYGAAFAGAVPAAEILVCAASVSAISAVGSNLVWGLERSDVDFFASLVGAVLALINGAVLIAPFGDMGAATSRALTQGCAVAIASWFLWARLGFRIPLLALAKLAAAALVCAAAARGIVIAVPHVPGLCFAIAVGAVVYVALVRLLGALAKEDTERLRGALRALPWPIARHAEPLALLILG